MNSSDTQNIPHSQYSLQSITEIVMFGVMFSATAIAIFLTLATTLDSFNPSGGNELILKAGDIALYEKRSDGWIDYAKLLERRTTFYSLILDCPTSSEMPCNSLEDSVAKATEFIQFLGFLAAVNITGRTQPCMKIWLRLNSSVGHENDDQNTACVRLAGVARQLYPEIVEGVVDDAARYFTGYSETNHSTNLRNFSWDEYQWQGYEPYVRKVKYGLMVNFNQCSAFYYPGTPTPGDYYPKFDEIFYYEENQTPQFVLHGWALGVFAENEIKDCKDLTVSSTNSDYGATYTIPYELSKKF